MTTKPKVTPKAKPAPASPKKPAGKAVRAAIYTLADPESGIIRYVGKANNPAARLKTHIRDSRRRVTPVCCWIKSLQSSGMTPVMAVVEWADDWEEAERRHIANYRSDGHSLLNLADGGGIPSCSRAVRARSGVRAAKSRDPAIWSYRRNIGGLIAWLAKNGRNEKAEMLKGVLRLFDMLTLTEQRALSSANLSRIGELT